MNEIFYPSHDGESTIRACVWKPCGEIKGVVQIIHGMAEHIERYAPFAEFLAERGYLVCGEDHLGHGKSVKDESELGYFNKQRSVQIIIDDIRALALAVKKQTGKPYFLLGHSMGSFFCRKYISLYGNELDGAIIMGTGFQSSLTLHFALTLVKINALFCGWRHRSKLIKKLAFGGYTKRFEPNKSQNIWLSKDMSNVEKYDADPMCGFDFTNNGYYVLFDIISQACAHKTIENVPKSLPVYFIAGAADPVGDYGKGVKKAKRKFDEADIKDVAITLYDGARHEILNDFCKEKVQEDILAFIENHSGVSNG